MNTQTIEVRTYLAELVAGIEDSFQTARRGIRITIDVPEVSFDPDTIRNLGLIVNEAVTNALKHAFNGLPGTIHIHLQAGPGTEGASGKHWVLTIEDDGKGIPPELPRTTDSLGFTILESLSENLNGTFTVEPAFPEKERPGTRVRVVFPAPSLKS